MRVSQPLRASLHPYLLFAPLLCSTLTSALNVVPSSPCSQVCSAGSVSPTQNEIVCLNGQFASTTSGSTFQKCVECELGSTAVDASTGISDVSWGLYNIRLAVSSCMFSYPWTLLTQSSPCDTTCLQLSRAIESGIDNNGTTTSPDLSFCNNSNFTDTITNKCVNCWGLMDDQQYLANFVQVLHIACRIPQKASEPFVVTPSTIFNTTILAGPVAVPASSNTHHHVNNLALIIALPVVAAFVIICLICIGCFYFTRNRRRRMMEEGNMRRLHESWGASPIASQVPQDQQFRWAEPMGMDRTHQGQKFQRRSDFLHYSYPSHHSYVDHVGPGEGQEKDPNLHDKFIPPPQPAEITVGQPTQFEMTPSLMLSMPTNTGVQKQAEEDFIEFSPQTPHLPQTFIYDERGGRYVKENLSSSYYQKDLKI